jgi:hypothetical protein
VGGKAWSTDSLCHESLAVGVPQNSRMKLTSGGLVGGCRHPVSAIEPVPLAGGVSPDGAFEVALEADHDTPRFAEYEFKGGEGKEDRERSDCTRRS